MAVVVCTFKVSASKSHTLLLLLYDVWVSSRWIVLISKTRHVNTPNVSRKAKKQQEQINFIFSLIYFLPNYPLTR